jgi:hypothetical protein
MNIQNLPVFFYGSRKIRAGSNIFNLHNISFRILKCAKIHFVQHSADITIRLVIEIGIATTVEITAINEVNYFVLSTVHDRLLHI